MLKINKDLIQQVVDQAKNSYRTRQHYNFHKSYKEPVQRLLNAMEPGSYFRPHNHTDSEKIEILLILQGSVAIVIFDDNGKIIESEILEQQGTKGIELYPDEWHMIIPLESGTVLYEIKEGPFEEEKLKVYAPWSPEHGSSEAINFMNKVLQEIGENRH